jgi:hypothetical protein
LVDFPGMMEELFDDEPFGEEQKPVGSQICGSAG